MEPRRWTDRVGIENSSISAVVEFKWTIADIWSDNLYRSYRPQYHWITIGFVQSQFNSLINGGDSIVKGAGRVEVQVGAQSRANGVIQMYFDRVNWTLLFVKE